MRFGILGPLQVLGDDGRELAVAGRMPRGLLALLLLRPNEVVPSDRLVEELWAGAPPASGTKGLQVHVSRLRQALAAGRSAPRDERVITTAGGYLLKVGADELDAAQGERLIAEGRSLVAAGRLEPAVAAFSAALALWRGTGLSDFQYEAFAQAEVARLSELRAAALEERIAAQMLLARDAEVLGELEGLVRAYPYRERLHGQLMLALYRAGRQAEALASYRAARSVLVDELGIEPSVELRQLHEAILAQDEALLAGDPPRPAAGDTAARTQVVSESPPTSSHVRLPVPATALIGRARELAELVALADSHRLITLTGPGGTGKTRLSLAVASQIAALRADGAVWVSLAMVTDPGLVQAAVATALGGIEDVSLYLQDRAMLLVLDNFEQVIDAGPAIGELLSGAPGCAAIVTSRERLGIAGEQEYPVPSLSPDDAAELFTTRAREVKPAFEPGRGVDAICERLDRLPLALELAATRVKLLSEQQLLDRLEQRLPLLAAGRRDAPARQRTMRAAIAWSYDLLTESEQRLFTRLAVFVGSFELEAAEEICGADLDTLQSLLDKSLVRAADDGRFFLLGTTREYALEQLEASGDRGQVRARHARWYLALGVAAGRQGAERADALARLRRDPGDVGRALSWALDHDIPAGLPLAGSLFYTWLGAGRIGELRRWYELALADPGTLASLERADALAGYGIALAYSDTPDPARIVLTEALMLYRESGDERNEARVLMRLGGVGIISGYPEQAVKWSEQALPIYERLEDPEGIARSLHYIADGLRDVGELERSAELYNRGIEIRREHGLGSIASAVHSLGDLSLDKHDLRSAEHYYQEALAAARDEDDVRLQAYCLAGLACVAAHSDDATTAGRLWTLAERIEQRIGFRMLHAERVRYEQTLTPALRDSVDYRAGVASAVDLDPPAAVAELLCS
jgi:predicted ATPase/DNA-binding SARP family transcriptional activator